MVQQKRKLQRSRNDRFLSGVAGGMAEFFDVDPVLVRLGWVVLTVVTGGIGLLVYLVLVIVTPNGSQAGSGMEGTADSPSDESVESEDETQPGDSLSGRHLVRNGLGVGLIIIGMIVLLGNLGVFESVRWDIVWPVVIVVLGAAILLPSIRR